MSTTPIESWTGADLSQIGPIYPFVGTEMVLVVVGLCFWLMFHILQARIEIREMEADERAARQQERLTRVFDNEARE